MSENAIVVENLSKRYLIGHRFSAQGRYKYTALRDVLGRKITNFVRKAADVVRGRQVVQGDAVEEFWALKDLSFEVKQGEILGIIGRNGAGKSTLLKILSRITEPTEGRIVLRERVSSLLEVGTGFHPELTGSENIFLNGAILGMTQREIGRKFDEIVAFAEVDRFVDTPVKYYSSGMYVRLAFAVAAHLEPEILIVDEVLAVGDSEFQKKCLGKMDEASRKQGRTVLFVSHNMEAVLKLCSRGLLLQDGYVQANGDVETVVSAYLSSQSTSPNLVDLLNKPRPGDFTGNARLAKASPSDPGSSWSIPFGKELSLDLSIEAEATATRIEVAVAVFSLRGFAIAAWTNRCSKIELPVHPGTNTFRLTFNGLRLLPSQYVLGIGLNSGRGFEEWIPDAIQLEITSTPETADMNVDALGGSLLPDATVSILE